NRAVGYKQRFAFFQGGSSRTVRVLQLAPGAFGFRFARTVVKRLITASHGAADRMLQREPVARGSVGGIGFVSRVASHVRHVFAGATVGGRRATGKEQPHGCEGGSDIAMAHRSPSISWTSSAPLACNTLSALAASK